ncbi:hypothetical protein [Sedimentitalea sp.]|uniref:NAD(P)/FAD-dependent oxidoreductase n=1 Tax=Sedimentitalea sp. TaxID=2048915 RepID=UPI003298517F
MRDPFSGVRLPGVDVAILGGGVAAWACAAMLREKGLSVGVLTRGRGLPSVGEYLPPEGIAALNALGLGAVLNNAAHRASRGTLSLWGTAEPLRRDVLMLPGGRAFCLDRAVFENDLKALALDRGAIQMSISATPGVSGAPGAWLLDLRSAGLRPLEAGFLIDATGRAASLSRALGARVTRHDSLVGLGLFWSQAPTDDAALRTESWTDGWCYAAPLSGQRLVAVMLTDTGLLPRGGAERRAFARRRIAQTRLIAPLCATARIEDFRALPAGSQVTEPNCGPGWAAVGDAAMGFDPLASAGLTKALLDIRETFSEARFDHDRQRAARAARYADYRQELRQVYRAEQGFITQFWAAR